MIHKTLKRRYRVPQYIVPVGGKWRKIKDKWLEDVLLKEDLENYLILDELIYEYQQNPLAFSIPHGRANEGSNDGIDMMNDWESELIILTAGNQRGKALEIDTPVLTPRGFVRIGDIEVGDTVYGSNGKTCTVTGVFDQGERALTKMTLDNGELEVESDYEHLWKYMRPKRRSKGRPHYGEWDNVTSAEIMDIQKSGNVGMRGLIPVTEPVEFPERDFLIHPYLMGSLLGDGSVKSGITLTTADPETVEYIATILPHDTEIIHVKDYSYRIRMRKGYVRNNGCYEQATMQKELRRLGAWGLRCEKKFVPEEYKYASIDQRINVLRGLMDTDGTIDGKYKRQSFTSTSKQMAEDVQWLVRSLGGKAKIAPRQTFCYHKGEERMGLPSWRVTVKLQDINPFWLPRKADQWAPINRTKERVVTSVVDAGKTAECRCITVDSPDNTYLIEDFVVTHNSFQGALKCLLKILPCDPDWPIFQEHGVEWREWDGPQKLIIASYKLDPSVKTVWETYLKLIPRSELGRYAPMWGAFPGEKGAAKAYSFNKPQSHMLACGSEVTMLSYQQSLTAFESMQCDVAHLDEQAPEDKFDGVDARMLTRGDYTPIVMTLTPHMVDGRRDTGANGWICKNVLGKDQAKGRKVKHYVIDTDCVPEVFMSKEKKAQAYEKNIQEPIRLNDDSALRHGKSRYFGEPEEGGDIILSSFNSNIHMVEPFDLAPFHPTYMRFIDHGKNPCACILMAYLPWDYIVCYKEYYHYGETAIGNAKNICELSGNTREEVGMSGDGTCSWPIFNEVQNGTQFAVSECDVRSFSKMSDESRRTIGQMYNQSGCRCYGASGTHRDAGGVIPLLNEWFVLRENQKHLNHWLKRPIPKEAQQFGAPKIYMFDNLKNTKNEIQGWIENPATGKPFDADDHLISCLLFMAARSRRYMGDYNNRVYRDEPVRRSVDEYSKY